MDHPLLVQITACFGDLLHDEEKCFEGQVSGAPDVLLKGPEQLKIVPLVTVLVEEKYAGILFVEIIKSDDI